jgi:hypothetical protein
MINYLTNRLDEFSSELKHTVVLPSVDGIIKRSIISNGDIASVNQIENESDLSSENVDIKKPSSAFPSKIFRMRPSILTELLEVSHIRSIRQIFISILVILVLQVAVTDLFESGA